MFRTGRSTRGTRTHWFNQKIEKETLARVGSSYIRSGEAIWAKLNNSDTIAGQECLGFAPIAVDGIQDLRSAAACKHDGDKYSVIAVKTPKTLVVWELLETPIVVLSNGDPFDALLFELVIEDMLEKGVAGAGLARMRKPTPILRKDNTSIVNHYNALLYQRFKA